MVEVARVLAPVVALTVGYLLFYQGGVYAIGRFESVRNILPRIDPAAREAGFYTSYQIGKNEFAGRLMMGEDRAVEHLKDAYGAIDNPLAAHKNDWAGREEVASLAFHSRSRPSDPYDWTPRYTREDYLNMSRLRRWLLRAVILRHQLHITLFVNEGGGVIVTGHWEYSPYNAFTAYRHFRPGDGNDPEAGVASLRALLSDDPSFSAREI